MPSTRSEIFNDAGPAPQADGRLAEAARYALLRRLAPTIRHHLAGALQPLSMAAMVLQRRLQKTDPQRETLEQSAGDIVSLASEASAASQHLMGWFFPKDTQTVALAKGVDECVGMVQAEFSFRGFSVANEVEDGDEPVSLAAIRGVLTAALMALADASAGPGRFVVRAEASRFACAISVALHRSEQPPGPAHSLAYRKIQWCDVEALASDGSAQLDHADGWASLRFPTRPSDLVGHGSIA